MSKENNINSEGENLEEQNAQQEPENNIEETTNEPAEE